MLKISEACFNELYPDLVGHYDFYNKPPPVGISKEEFERKYLASKLWRLNNLYYIIDKYGEPVKFVMNEAQHVSYAASRQHSRLIILKSRQQGISTLWLVSMFDDAVCCPFLNVGLMAQGTDEASTLLERTKFLWDNLNDGVKAYLRIKVNKDNTKEIGFSNNSNIFIRVSFRSTTLQRLHISEYGKIANDNPKRAKETKTGTLQAIAAGNTAVIESTAEGENDFKRTWDSSVLAEAAGQLAPKDFKPIFLSWLQDPDCRLSLAQTDTPESLKYFTELAEQGIHADRDQKNFWIAQYRELGEDVYQEYPATPEEAFRKAKDGTYYASLYRKHVVQGNKLIKGLYDPNLPISVFFDIGVDDYTVMFFVQWYRGTYRIVHEYWNSGMWLGHYIDYAFAESGFRVDELIFPHDIKVREQGSKGARDTANSRLDIVKEHMKDHKYEARVDYLERGSESDGIEAVKRMIPKLEIDPSCEYAIGCLLNFSKEYDDKLQQWKPTPAKSTWNHGADTLRYIATGLRENTNMHQSKLGTRQQVHSRLQGYDV